MLAEQGVCRIDALEGTSTICVVGVMDETALMDDVHANDDIFDSEFSFEEGGGSDYRLRHLMRNVETGLETLVKLLKECGEEKILANGIASLLSPIQVQMVEACVLFMMQTPLPVKQHESQGLR
ncbi:hypothetical protein [Paludibacterium paludis]|uniref:Uncharacterized protein n=1 Tax=Paludibacterium paludis TaxID=1225769 RepID=A0A918UAC0_9NEIS|nr:hypothetical protein [Paludibacterium paludis]GGY20870.1 hypothetical protein GCM10011289_25640 [Paludibacterium paludis]